MNQHKTTDFVLFFQSQNNNIFTREPNEFISFADNPQRFFCTKINIYKRFPNLLCQLNYQLNSYNVYFLRPIIRRKKNWETFQWWINDDFFIYVTAEFGAYVPKAYFTINENGEASPVVPIESVPVSVNCQ